MESALSFTVSASDREGGTLTYSAAPLPTGAGISPVNGGFTWTPHAGQDGTYSLTVHVTDPQGAADSQAVLITVTPGSARIAPPGSCAPDTMNFAGTIGLGVNGSPSDTQTHTFPVGANVSAIQGSLNWTGGPAIDLDLYLLDPGNNIVSSSASLSDPEVATYSTPGPGTYTWKVVSYNNPNPSLAYTLTSVRCTSAPAGVGSGSDRGIQFSLSQNEPNPFTRSSVIRFALPRATPLQLAIYDLTGRRVRTLVNGTLEAGLHQRVWDGRDDAGVHVASGVYFYKLNSSLGERSHKMMLLR